MRSRTQRWLVWTGRALVAGLALVLLAGTAATFAQSRTQRVLSNVRLEDEPVGGLSHSELTDVAAALRSKRENATVTVVGERGTVTGSRGEIGSRFDAGTAVERAWSHGRRDPIRSLYDHVRSLLGATSAVRLPMELDHAALDVWSEEAAAELSTPARAATVEFHDGPEPPEPGEPRSRAEAVDPAPGEEVDAAALRERLARTLQDSRGPVEIETDARTIDPPADERDLQAVLPDARTAVSSAVRMENPSTGADIVLSPRELATVLDVRLDEERPPGSRLRLAAEAERLEQVLGQERIEATEGDPVEAYFVVVDSGPQVRGGTPGYRFEPEAAAESVVEVAAREQPRSGELGGESLEPELTREEAEGLGIDEQVSSFTTSFSCCQPRVTNIHRGADLLTGAIVRPGERFSLDRRIGPRTHGRGFVDAGVIVDGEFEQEPGGGLSQLATTFFNAVFFSGVDIIEHQPHSYYFERYPMGRESTIARGVIDVVFDNDSPYGILMVASYTSTTVTVSFYSTDWAEVDPWMSEPFNRVEGEVRDGFDIRYGRTVTYPDGTSHEDAWFHRYQPQDG